MNDWTDDEKIYETDEVVEILLDKVPILRILDKCEVEYFESPAGEFTHKAHCPLPVHDFGTEPTASLFISEKNNNFYCFGCNSHGNIIDFISLFKGMPYRESIKWLSDFACLTAGDLSAEGYETKKRDPEQKVSTHVFRAGVKVREFLKSKKGSDKYAGWETRMDKILLRLDNFLNECVDDNWEKVKKYCDRVIEFLERNK